MTADHDRFETLAGAVMLGEATVAERTEFAAHAEECAACAADLAEVAPLERVAAVREAETWRPDVSDGVLRRVRARREGRLKIVLGGLGTALALSVGLEIVLSSGAGSQLASAFDPQPVVGMAVSSQLNDRMHAIDPKASAFALAAGASEESAAAKRRAAKARAERLALAKRKSAAHARTQADAALEDPVDSHASARKLIPTEGVVVADPLAGTPLDPAVTAKVGDGRHVAVEPRIVIPESLRR